MSSLPEGGKNGNITIKDVASALGVSTTTVSRAISGKGRISEETVCRVREYIQEHNYVPNAIAQGLAGQKTYNIGVIVPETDTIDSHSFFRSCVAGVCQELSDTLYDVLMIIDDDGNSGKLARALERGKLDGAIVSRAHVGGKTAGRLRQAGVPFVLVGTSPDKTIYQVDHNYRTACKELTSLLLEEGRDLALFGGDLGLYVTQDRLQGFLDAHRAADLPMQEDRMYFGLDNPERVEGALDAALTSGAECLVCMDDRICAMTLSLLHRRGLGIPEDIQIASFYDSYALERYTPAITALRFDAKKLGKAACRMLLEQLEGRGAGTVKTVGYDIAVRTSTQINE